MTNKCPVCGSSNNDGALSCTTCGFNFVQKTKEFDPIEINNTQVQTKKPSVKQASLLVVQGPRNGALFTLDGSPKTVGRSPACDIFLNDMTVSRRHAVLAPIRGGYSITDQKSYNGTWVNNKNIESIALKDGDMVQMGAFVLQFKCN
ncbi:MAG: FHA domain-containing protein [Eggerthellaceae bacterium]|nr:FHA domain-containing protein [Eggerthellaceae bacterium]